MLNNLLQPLLNDISVQKLDFNGVKYYIIPRWSCICFPAYDIKYVDYLKKSGGGEGVFISTVCLLPNKLTLSYYISFSLPDTEITSPA